MALKQVFQITQGSKNENSVLLAPYVYIAIIIKVCITGLYFTICVKSTSKERPLAGVNQCHTHMSNMLFHNF